MEATEIQHLTEDQVRASALWAKPNLNTEEENLFQTLSYRRSLDLTPEEEEAVIAVAVPRALSEAKKAKADKEYSRLYAKKTMAEPVYPDPTAKEFFELIIQLGSARFAEKKLGQFTVDENNEKIIKLLSLYFTGDLSLHKYGLSVNKGILLVGGVGCGKTQLMSLCRVNRNASYTQHDCADISAEYQQDGAAAIDKYSENTRNNLPDHAFGLEFFGRFFDDLGSETLSKNFGTERNVMAEIIQQRYKYHPHYMTHFTSNLTLEQLSEAYGSRVADRLKEMCNVIEFPSTAKSRRR